MALSYHENTTMVTPNGVLSHSGGLVKVGSKCIVHGPIE